MVDHSARSPTASTCSGTTTNPNTPRPNHDYEHNQEHTSEGGRPDSNSPQPGRDKSNSFGDAETSDKESPPSSAASRQRAHDIQPTWPQKVTKTSALALWQSNHHLDNITLQLNWTPHNTSGSAFFRIQAGLQFEGGPSAQRDGRVSVFIFIHPERISELIFDEHPAAKPFGPNTVALTFQMNRAPALVLPRTFKCVSPSAEATMTSLQELTTQLSFTVYTSLPRRTLPISRLRQLCTAITDHKLSSTLACADLPRLYGGYGAQLLEGDELSEPALDPPPYDVGSSPHLSKSQSHAIVPIRAYVSSQGQEAEAPSPKLLRVCI